MNIILFHLKFIKFELHHYEFSILYRRTNCCLRGVMVVSGDERMIDSF